MQMACESQHSGIVNLLLNEQEVSALCYIGSMSFNEIKTTTVKYVSSARGRGTLECSGRVGWAHTTYSSANGM